MYELTPVLAAVHDILSEIPKREAHINEIAQKAVELNKNFAMTQDDFAKKISSALASSVKRKGSPFARVVGKKDLLGKIVYRKGMYRIKQVRIKTIDIVPPPDVNTLFLGKAGEMAVMSELLFWGFNASLMSVDQGIDIVASKGEAYFHLQVKTATQRSDGKYFFSIKKKSFEANNTGKTFYIFLMRTTQQNNIYAIFPSSYLDIQCQAGGIKSSDSSISLTISADAKNKEFIMNGKQSVTMFINNFAQIV